MGARIYQPPSLRKDLTGNKAKGGLSTTKVIKEDVFNNTTRPTHLIPSQLIINNLFLV